MLIHRKQVAFTAPSAILPTIDPGLDAEGIQQQWLGAIPCDLSAQLICLLDQDADMLDWRRLPEPVVGTTVQVQFFQDGNAPDPPDFWIPALDNWTGQVVELGNFDGDAASNVLTITPLAYNPVAPTLAIRALWTTGLRALDREVLTVIAQDVIADMGEEPTEPGTIALYVNGVCFMPGLSPGLTYQAPLTLVWDAAAAGFHLTPNDLLICESL